jgi:hypothetical protein
MLLFLLMLMYRMDLFSGNSSVETTDVDITDVNNSSDLMGVMSSLVQAMTGYLRIGYRQPQPTPSLGSL